METLEQKLTDLDFSPSEVAKILNATGMWLTQHAQKFDREHTPEWAAAIRFTYRWLREEEEREPHDLQCATCGVEIKNQCLDPDCDQDHPHSNGDAYCEEHLVSHAN